MQYRKNNLGNVNRYGQPAEAFEGGRTGKIWVLLPRRMA